VTAHGLGVVFVGPYTAQDALNPLHPEYFETCRTSFTANAMPSEPPQLCAEVSDVQFALGADLLVLNSLIEPCDV
jgi:hypothetical protein